MRSVAAGIMAVVLIPACGVGPADSDEATNPTQDVTVTGDTATVAAELRWRRRPRPPGNTGGAMGTGGRANTGGTTGTGGTPNTGGTTNTGGRANTGGTTGTGGAAAPPVGQLVFVGDFETGDLSQWAYVERCQPDRILVYSAANAPAGAPAPRQGTHAARFRVLDSDVAPCTSTENPRAELETPESLFKPGDDRWEAWSLYVPASYPAPRGDGWFAFQEDYGAPWDGSPSIGWFLDFGNGAPRIRMDRGAQYGHDQPLFAPLATGRWVDFLVHKKFANTINGGGFVEAWVDKAPMTFSACSCTKLSTQTMHDSQRSVGFYLTSYRARGTFDSFDTYYDGVRIGTTRAAVELP